MSRSSPSIGGEAKPGDVGTIEAATQILDGRSGKRGLARLLPFLGPAFVASVAYVDPGNYEIELELGDRLRLRAVLALQL